MLMQSVIKAPQTGEEVELCIYGSIVDFVIRVSSPADKVEYKEGYVPAPELGCLRVKSLPGHCIVSGILDEKIVGDARYCSELVDKILEENMEITEEVHCSVQVVRQVSVYEMTSESEEDV
ncbi:MAG: hypothetical protein NE327_02240 [Lentisphaeraceae bacterium]|nr:hypothetical protein [Lentisphaeraceae bacterium]